MADDERRAEIEAARDGLQRILDMPCPFGKSGDLLGQAQRVASETITELNRLDRVRDARGDDEVPRCNVPGCIRLFGHDGGCEYGAARSPQSEDHEGLARALERVLGRIDTEEAAANAVEAVCRALGYRPDAAPSRDGSVAVEDVTEWLAHRTAMLAAPQVIRLVQEFRAEFSPASTGDQAST